MIGYIVKKFIGSKNEREVKRLRPMVEKINQFEADLQKLTPEALRQKTATWKEELSKIEDKEELARRLDEILPEAFAVVKNACRRLCGTELIVRDHPLKWELIPFVVRFLGLTVGCILHDQPPNVRREQYNCDITYGTNAEFGFDYLRDNGMAIRKEDQVQRSHYFAIVDEVDSILILSLIHISEPTRLLSISYAVFCLKKKKIQNHIALRE